MPASRTRSGTRAPAALAAAGVLATVVLASGCGGNVIDDQKLEAQIAANLEGRTGVMIASVVCPTGVDVEPGRRFDCEARTKTGRRARVTVLIRNRDADVTIVALSATR